MTPRHGLELVIILLFLISFKCGGISTFRSTLGPLFIAHRNVHIGGPFEHLGTRPTVHNAFICGNVVRDEGKGRRDAKCAPRRSDLGAGGYNSKDEYHKRVDDYLIRNRTIFLSGELDDNVSYRILTSILRINEDDPEKPIRFYINSPGGSVSAGLAIYDLLKTLSMPVETICLGQAASMGAFLLAAGTKGMRFAMPNSKIMIHQPLGGAHGQATDIEIQANEILQTRQLLNTHLANFTGKTIEEIEKDCDRDYYMRPSEALEYGLIDAIVNAR